MPAMPVFLVLLILMQLRMLLVRGPKDNRESVRGCRLAQEVVKI